MRLIFVGTPPNAALALEKISKEHDVVLVVTRADAESGRKRELKPSAVAEKATSMGLPILKSNRLTSMHQELIRSANAELAIVVAYGALIPSALLEILPWWNLHFSLLPQWRGATPLQHSMLSGGKGSGISLFRLDEGMDTGPVISQRAVPIDFNKSCGDLLQEFTDLGADLILEALTGLPNETAQVGEQSLAPKIPRSAGRVNWKRPATELMWQIMALNPEPGAWCEVENQPLKLLRARSLGNTDWNALDGVDLSPGQIQVSDGRVTVCCGGGTRLELIEVQPAGKKVMRAMDWVRGAGKGVTLD